MLKKIRRQLTLFVEHESDAAIETVRQKFNPKQSRLIKSHVTLCREDEIEDIERVLKNICSLSQSQIIIDFGKPIRFDNGKGVLLPAKSDDDFKKLRRNILTGVVENPRLQEPHVTLMHPRNSTCTDDIFKEISLFNFPETLVFKNIDLIEQTDDLEWKTLQRFPLS